MNRLIVNLIRVAALHHGQHRYLSAYCLHGQHASCRRRCEVCASPCLCECHGQALVSVGVVLESRIAGMSETTPTEPPAPEPTEPEQPEADTPESEPEQPQPEPNKPDE
jgi:hypothetical protein